MHTCTHTTTHYHLPKCGTPGWQQLTNSLHRSFTQHNQSNQRAPLCWVEGFKILQWESSSTVVLKNPLKTQLQLGNGLSFKGRTGSSVLVSLCGWMKKLNASSVSCLPGLPLIIQQLLGLLLLILFVERLGEVILLRHNP